MTRSDILPRHHRLRENSNKLHHDFMDVMASDVTLGRAERLQGKMVALDNPDEMKLVEDLATYMPRQGRSHPLDRYARAARFAQGSVWNWPTSTGGNKAKLVRKALSMHQFDHTWMLPSRLASSSLPWLIEVDGLIVDARRLPVAIQAAAVRKGLMPFVHLSTDQTATEPA